MIHPASHLTLTVFSRAKGNSAVAAAAYRARSSMVDQRRGRRFTYQGLGGLLSCELVGWKGDREALWNAAEETETRSNARVARELRPALPAELPLAEQVRLVRGMCLWLRDRYGVASQAAIHAPTFHDPAEGKAYWERLNGAAPSDADLERLNDPQITNKNFHAHILFTTRRVDPATGAFLEKTRVLDDAKQGPEELKIIRKEWERRTNSALARCGSKARIDVRSYRDMAAAGDAPEGLRAQTHLGPRRTAQLRRLRWRQATETYTSSGRLRVAVRAHNDTLWEAWVRLSHLKRQKALLDAEAAREEEARVLRLQRELRVANARVKAAQTEDQYLKAQKEVERIKSARDGDPKAMMLDDIRNGVALESDNEPVDDWIDLEAEPPDTRSVGRAERSEKSHSGRGISRGRER